MRCLQEPGLPGRPLRAVQADAPQALQDHLCGQVPLRRHPQGQMRGGHPHGSRGQAHRGPHPRPPCAGHAHRGMAPQALPERLPHLPMHEERRRHSMCSAHLSTDPAFCTTRQQHTHGSVQACIQTTLKPLCRHFNTLSTLHFSCAHVSTLYSWVLRDWHHTQYVQTES